MSGGSSHPHQLLGSPDGHWIVQRRGREVRVLAGLPRDARDEPGGEPGAALELAADDDELATLGPPSSLVAIGRHALTLFALPSLEAAPPLALEAPMRLAAITGPRLALVGEDGKRVLVVRCAARALAAQALEPGAPVELAVGLEKHQLLLALPRKLEVWDAVSCRPLLRLQLQLPPPPRRVGVAQGHLWVTRPGSDEVFVYRLSDGRPFRHHAGAPVEHVVCHPQSPVLVLVTAHGLVRLHCFAHSLARIALPERAPPWPRTAPPPLAQLVSGDDVVLVGDTGADEPWRVSIGASAAAALDPIAPPPIAPPPFAPPPSAPITAAPPAASTRAPEPPASGVPASPAPATPAPSPPRDPTWRDVLVAPGAALARGEAATLPELPANTELAELADRLALGADARRGLVALYAAYLAGAPALPIAQLARVAGWREPLGHGELGALVRRARGRVALRRPVTDALDGHVAELPAG